MAGLGDLVVRLSAETAQFTQALDKATYQSQKNFDKMVSSAKTAGFAIAGAFAIGEFTSMARKAIQFADTMQDVATANEIGVESVLALGEALNQNGGKAENAGKMFSSLNAKIYEAAEGSKSAQDAFVKAGVSIKDLGNLSTIDLFDKLIKKIADTTDASLRNGMAMDFFGKAAKGVDFVGLAQGTDEARAKFIEYAESIRIAADLNDKLEANTNKMLLVFTTNFVPTMNTIYESANKGGNAFKSLMEFGGEAFKGLTYGLRNVVTGFQVLNASVNLVGLTLSDIASGKFNTFFDRLKEYETYVGDLRAKDKEFARDLMNNNKEIQKSNAETSATSRKITPAKDPEASKWAKSLQDAIYISQKFTESMNDMAEKNKLAFDAMFMTEEQRKKQETLLTIENAYRDSVAKLNKELGQGYLKQQDYDANLGKLTDSYEKAKVKAEELLVQQERLNGSWEYGATKALYDYANESNNVAKSVQNLVNNGLKKMEDGLYGIVTGTMTVKQAFRSMASSIVEDIIRMQIQQRISSALNPIINAALGNISTSMTYGTNIGSEQTRMLAEQDKGLTGYRASGGLVSAGSSYLVGERGAEVFTPSVNGNISSNGDMGGTVINQTINISAGVAQTVRTEIQAMMPRIMEATKSAVADGKRRGGTYGAMLA